MAEPPDNVIYLFPDDEQQRMFRTPRLRSMNRTTSRSSATLRRS